MSDRQFYFRLALAMIGLIVSVFAMVYGMVGISLRLYGVVP